MGYPDWQLFMSGLGCPLKIGGKMFEIKFKKNTNI
jgi:hypothetical protein